jgi:protease-4
MRSRITRATIVALAALVLAGPRAAAAYPRVHGNESVAASDDATGFLVNPAAGGARYPGELLVARADREPDGSAWLGALSHDGLGLAARGEAGRARAWTLGLRGSGASRLGLAIHWLRGPDARATDYTLGLLARPAPWLSWGAVADHLTRPRVAGLTLDRTWTLGIGVRPLALAPAAAHRTGPAFTLTADLVMDEHARRTAARARFGAELEPLPGLVLRGSTDRDGFRLGVGIRGVRSAYHGSRAFDREQRPLATTHAISFHHGEDRTVLASRADRRVAVLRLSGQLGDDALAGFTLLEGGERARPVGPIHRALERAREDPLTRGVLLELGGVGNMAQLEELRPRVQALRRAGKPVVAYLEQGGGRGDLYLASACDRVVAAEEAIFQGLGLRVERRYYRGLLADWGLTIDRASHGRYKSAYRSWSADSTPPADREAIEHALDRVQELFVSAVTANRRMDRARLLTLLDGRNWPTEELRKAGLVDSIGYREDALRILGGLSGLGKRPRQAQLSRTPEAARAWRVPARVAVVYASGAIESGESGGDLLLGPYMGARTVVRQLEAAFRHPGVRAVVLRVESPGGSGPASHQIDHAVQRLRRETGKPLIVSMGGVAASGGYYIAAHADRIYADRFTRTGSIGVLFLKPSLERWYREHGVRQDEFERGRYMRGTSLGRDWDPEIQAHADSSIQWHYRRFVARVAEGRGLAFAAADSVAQGRVWLGEDARARGLVDEIGGLDAAIAEARRRAGVPPGERIEPLEFRRPRPPLLGRLLGPMVGELWARTFHLPDPGAAYYLTDDELED